MGIYSLDAEKVPILIGADLLEEWGALISFLRNSVKLENSEEQPTLKLTCAASGQRLLDMAGLATAMSTPPRE